MKGSVDPTTFYAAALPTTGAYILRNFQNVILVRCKLNLCLRGIIIHFYYRKIKNIWNIEINYLQRSISRSWISLNYNEIDIF